MPKLQLMGRAKPKTNNSFALTTGVSLAGFSKLHVSAIRRDVLLKLV